MTQRSETIKAPGNGDYPMNSLTDENSILLDLPERPSDRPATSYSKFPKDKQYFHVMSHLEPHNIRRVKILEKYPQVEKLLAKDKSSFYWSIALNLVQLLICYLIRSHISSWLHVILLAYFLGAVINHGLFVLMHDITHFTSFKSITLNQLCAILTNLPQVIPSAISFGRYHRDHHTFLGDALEDPDLPTEVEIKFINNTISKLLFICTMPFFYALRPYFKRPKVTNLMETLNILSCCAYGILIFRFFGAQALSYLVLGTLFGLSIHPVGAHIIAEHYEFNKCQDTYSYYGWLNYLNFNIGYHIEHHDFPNIPWNKLPELRKIAPEFYETLPQVDSYVTVMFNYIFDEEIGPWSRIARKPRQ